MQDNTIANSVNLLFLLGIGWGMVMISTMTCIYYNVIVMYSFMFICLSLVNIGWAVPWASCDNDWNTPICRDKPLIKLDEIESVAEKITASICKYLSLYIHLLCSILDRLSYLSCCFVDKVFLYYQ